MQPAPASAREYRDLVEDAAYEIRELQRCAEDDMDDELSDLIPAFIAIEHALEDLSHGKIPCTAESDLPFMVLAKTYRHVIPVFSMLEVINRAHRNGMVIVD